LLHVERLITLLGASYHSNLTRKRSLLLTPDNNLNGPKMAKAKEWGIPVVNVGWLWKVISESDEDIDIGPWSGGPTCNTLTFRRSSLSFGQIYLGRGKQWFKSLM
jgi:hypothetical protein